MGGQLQQWLWVNYIFWSAYEGAFLSSAYEGAFISWEGEQLKQMDKMLTGIKFSQTSVGLWCVGPCSMLIACLCLSCLYFWMKLIIRVYMYGLSVFLIAYTIPHSFRIQLLKSK